MRLLLFVFLVFSLLGATAFSGGIAFWNSAPPVFVQSEWQQTAGSVSTQVKAFDAPNTIGNLIVVYCGTWTSTATSQTVTDTLGNTYTNILTQAQSTGRAMIFYAVNVVTGANTVTCHFNLTDPNGGGIEIGEYSGLSKVAPLDASTQATGTGTSSTMSLTTTNPYDMVIEFSGESRTAASNGFVIARSAGVGLALANKVQPRAGSVTGGYSFAGSETWYDVMIAFKTH